jgi:hypothetical protein
MCHKFHRFPDGIEYRRSGRSRRSLGQDRSGTGRSLDDQDRSDKCYTSDKSDKCYTYGLGTLGRSVEYISYRMCCMCYTYGLGTLGRSVEYISYRMCRCGK